MLFTGTFEHKIDAKGRMAIPRELREQIDFERDGKFLYVTIQQLGQKLGIYTEAEFKRQAELLNESDLSAEEVLAFEYVFFKHAHRVEPDGQGRIKIPERLIEKTGLGSRDVVISGVKDHIEIEDRNVHDENMDEIYEKHADLLKNMRVFHHRGKKAE